MACEHDEIINSLCAFSSGAQFLRRGARPVRAPLLVVLALRVVDRIVEPEADLDLGPVLRQRDDVSNLVEALGEMLLRVVVPMRLGVATEHVGLKPPERRESPTPNARQASIHWAVSIIDMELPVRL